jgi:hypothetical protein
MDLPSTSSSLGYGTNFLTINNTRPNTIAFTNNLRAPLTSFTMIYIYFYKKFDLKVCANSPDIVQTATFAPNIQYIGVPKVTIAIPPII